MNESQIFAEIRAGDTDKFGLLYDAYAKRIWNYLFYRVRDRDTAEDLMSVTFFKAIEKFATFDESKGTFSAWIYRIARNTLLDHVRAAKHMEPLEYLDEVVGPTDVMADAMDRESAESVKKAFAALDADQREIIALRVESGMSFAEIATVVGKSEAASKMAFYRAIERLKAGMPAAALLILIWSASKG